LTSSSSELTLIVLAAGIGSRYGGLKQMDSVGPHGELIIDYSVYDALRAGFGRVIFLIRRDIESIFRDKIGHVVESRAETTYVFQDLTNIPCGFTVSADRLKPWGTAHAVLCCKDVVRTPFAVINADDFYGATAYQALATHLRGAHDRNGIGDYCMVGYALHNTLSAHGHVARGVCQMTKDGYLADVRERTRIQQFADGIRYTENGTDWTPLPPDSIVSMNIWGFTLSFFAELETRFPLFLRQNAANLAKAELLLPNVVGDLAREGKARVKVLPTAERWFGMTYREDRPQVQAAIGELIGRGIYPEKLWSN
jgi:hypothetical protein